MAKKAVSDSTVLIFLSNINRLELLWNVYDEVIIPNHVKEEVLVKDETGLLKKALLKVTIKDPKNKKDFKLGKGESESIQLCLEEGIKDFLSDDKRARSVAKLLKLNRVGTIGILLWNLKRGYLKKTECSMLLEELIRKNYRISTELYAKIKGLIESIK